MATISLQRLAHSYQMTTDGQPEYVLRDINICCQDGLSYALLGPSGCGKSTLLNIISGLLRPTEGQLFFDQQEVTEWSPEQRQIAQVFQFPVVYDSMTVYENLAFPLRNRGLDPSAIRKRVDTIATTLELGPLLQQKARSLTADIQQKIALGRGLVREQVAAILFDEPLTVIDPHLKWLLRAELKRLQQQLRRTMIYVTHDQTEAMTFADQVVVMNQGEILQTDTPQALFTRPKHRFVGYFIGSPGMNLLPTRIDGNKAFLGAFQLPLQRHYENFGKARVELGIRPEYLRLSSTEGFPAQRLRVDDIGRHRVIYMRFQGQQLAVLQASDEALREEQNKLCFNPEYSYVYADGWLQEGRQNA